MRDARKIQDRVEFRLDRPQVVWLTLGGVVLMGVMFALGVIVGRRAERLTEAPRAAADPLAVLDQDGDIHKKLTFYTRLMSPEHEAAGLLPKPPVTGTQSPALTVTPPPPPPVALAPAPESAKPLPPAVAPEGERAAAKESDIPSAKSGQYTVQVSAFHTQDEAQAYSAVLTRKGYKPFVVAATVPGRGTWYRVRIGSFSEEEEAQRTKGMLARSDIPGWVLKTE